MFEHLTPMTPQQLADRADFAEIVDEDPRSYQRAVEHHNTHTPTVQIRRSWSLSSLAEAMDGTDGDAA